MEKSNASVFIKPSVSETSSPTSTQRLVSTSTAVSTKSSPSNAFFFKFLYTGQIQSFTVPLSGLIEITAAGASGGFYRYSGGNGGLITGKFQVNAGQELYVSVGQAGSSPGYCNGASGTFGGGGGSNCGGGQGGGASDVRTSQYDLTSRLIVAGGGGGGAYGSSGGCGGGLVACKAPYSSGANQTHGGVTSLNKAANGGFGVGGNGQGSSNYCCATAGGGTVILYLSDSILMISYYLYLFGQLTGGGGYYGGGGGIGDQGGAGGSSYCHPSGAITSNLQGINSGNGYVNMLLTKDASVANPTSVPIFYPTKQPVTSKRPTNKPIVPSYSVSPSSPSLLPTKTFEPTNQVTELNYSHEPTMTSTSFEAYFQVTQIFNNLNCTAIDTSYGIMSIQQTVSLSLNSQVPPEYIQIISITQVAQNIEIASHVNIIYMIYFFSSSTELANSMYNAFSQLLVTSVIEGTFQTYFVSAAISNRIAGVTQVSVTETPVISSLQTLETTATSSPTYSMHHLAKESNQATEQSPVVAGVVTVGVVTGVVAITFFFYYFFHRKPVVSSKMLSKTPKGTNVLHY